MSRPARSLLVFGVYLLVLGPALALVPNTVTRLVSLVGALWTAASLRADRRSAESVRS